MGSERYLTILAYRVRAQHWLALALAVVIEVAVLVPLGSLLPPRHILSIAGSLIAVIVVVTGMLAGPLMGLLTGTSGGIVFFFTVAHLGEVSSGPTVMIAAGLWAISGVICGVIADALRRSAAQRRRLAVSLAREEATRRAHEERARLAATLTASLLPRLPDTHADLELISLYRPGEQRLSLGGDFMDAVPLPGDKLAVIIGDVAGHGPAAAALGASLRASWRSLILAGVPSDQLIATLNSLVLLEQQPEIYATACLGWIDPREGRATLLSAGHPKPFLIAHTPTRIEVASSLPLGVLETVDWQPGRVALPRRWSLFFYTDGLTEGNAWPTAAERYGEKRLMTLLCNGSFGYLDQTALKQLVEEITRANGSPLPDDVAVLVVRGQSP